MPGLLDEQQILIAHRATTRRPPRRRDRRRVAPRRSAVHGEIPVGCTAVLDARHDVLFNPLRFPRLLRQVAQPAGPQLNLRRRRLRNLSSGAGFYPAVYCETDIVNTYRVWLRTAARHRKRYLMPAARINLSFELSSAVTYLSISAGVIGIGLIASCFSLCRIAGVASTLVAVE